MKTQSTSYTLLGVYIIGGICFVVLVLGLSRWLQRRLNRDKASTTPYECGEVPVGHASHLFVLRYYLLALLFVLFEVELLLLLPWAKVMASLQQLEGNLAWVALVEMFVFLTLLLGGLIYVWKHGKLRSTALLLVPEDTPSKVPEPMYEALNSKYARHRITRETSSSVGN